MRTRVLYWSMVWQLKYLTWHTHTDRHTQIKKHFLSQSHKNQECTDCVSSLYSSNQISQKRQLWLRQQHSLVGRTSLGLVGHRAERRSVRPPADCCPGTWMPPCENFAPFCPSRWPASACCLVGICQGKYNVFFVQYMPLIRNSRGHGFFLSYKRVFFHPS
jgi:hypothetical protein